MVKFLFLTTGLFLLFLLFPTLARANCLDECYNAGRGLYECVSVCSQDNQSTEEPTPTPASCNSNFIRRLCNGGCHTFDNLFEDCNGNLSTTSGSDPSYCSEYCPTPEAKDICGNSNSGHIIGSHTESCSTGSSGTVTVYSCSDGPDIRHFDCTTDEPSPSPTKSAPTPTSVPSGPCAYSGGLAYEYDEELACSDGINSIKQHRARCKDGFDLVTARDDHCSLQPTATPVPQLPTTPPSHPTNPNNPTVTPTSTQGADCECINRRWATGPNGSTCGFAGQSCGGNPTTPPNQNPTQPPSHPTNPPNNPPSIRFIGYSISEDLSERDNSNSPQHQTDSTSSITLPFTFTSSYVGTKTIFVRFFYSDGSHIDNQQSIIYQPAPLGAFDGAECSVGFHGWACDPGHPNSSNKVDFYLDNGPQPNITNGIIEATANLPAANEIDAQRIAAACGGTSNHRFSIIPPGTTNDHTPLNDNHPHTIYAYAIGVDSGNNTQVNTQTYQCNPTVVVSPTTSLSAATPTPVPSCLVNYSLADTNPNANSSVVLTISNIQTSNPGCSVLLQDGGNMNHCRGNSDGTMSCTINSASSGPHTLQLKYGQSESYPTGTNCGNKHIECNSYTYNTK